MRDMIVNPHYNQTIELVMQKARDASMLYLLSHDFQVFGNISLYTTQELRSPKPLLVVLQ